MEDMISNNTREQQSQHRSSSFSDERDKINLDTLKEFHQQTNKNEYLGPPPTQQHRSLNDLTNKPLLTTHTMNRRPSISPIRKKPKLNIIVLKRQTVKTCR